VGVERKIRLSFREGTLRQEEPREVTDGTLPTKVKSEVDSGKEG